MVFHHSIGKQLTHPSIEELIKKVWHKHFRVLFSSEKQPTIFRITIFLREWEREGAGESLYPSKVILQWPNSLPLIPYSEGLYLLPWSLTSDQGSGGHLEMLKNTPPLLFASRLKRHISFRMKGLCGHKEMTFYHLCKSLSVFLYFYGISHRWSAIAFTN